MASTPDTTVLGQAVLSLDGLQGLIDALAADGFQVIAPVVGDGAIGYGAVARVADLPVGWGDEQDAASYRLRRRDDEMVFGYANGPQSAKPVFFPARDLLWRAHREADGFTVEQPAPDEGPFALLGVRSCDLSALGIHDTVLLGRAYVDASYAVRRADAFLVAVTCSDPAGTCFCVSMGTGPRPAPGASYDLALTEVLDEDGHRFLVDVGSERGADVLSRIDTRDATGADLEAADSVVEQAVGRMGRTLDTTGLKDLLYDGADSPMWDEVATRCLACSNCTMVCPTCFCTDVDDVTDLTGDQVARERIWDSCFDLRHSYLHGGSVRRSTPARYRQWMTHKLASWIDQFGTSGCVGCGRCITWCPAGIDLTAQVAALRAAPREVPHEEE
ncbi:MAG: 4Fe-4S dicluster domain-containing protein [Nocardioides sp.]